MIEFLTTEPGLVACRASGDLDPSDTDALMHEIELAVVENGKVNVYYELDDDVHLSPSAVLHGLRIALDLLARRNFLGRVAVVSDRLLLRNLWRIESMLMPHVSYRLFSKGRRDEAFDWLAERGDLPGPLGLRLLATGRDDTFAIELGLAISAQDLAELGQELDRRYSAGDLSQLFVGIRQQIGTTGLVASDLDKFVVHLRTLRQLERCALVGAPHRIEHWICLLAPLLAFELRVFPTSQEKAAWEWLETQALPGDPAAIEPATVL